MAEQLADANPVKRPGLDSVTKFEGTYGAMGERDHNGVDTRNQVLLTIANGRWKLVP